MAKVKRNEPCPCGSGIKSKFCCKQPHEYVDIRVLPLDLCQGVVNDLVGTTEAELGDLFDQLLYLPELDTSLQVRLGGIITPEIERAIHALKCDDDDEFDRALDIVVSTVDTLERRVELAEAVITLRDQGRIPATLAAVAVSTARARRSSSPQSPSRSRCWLATSARRPDSWWRSDKPRPTEEQTSPSPIGARSNSSVS